jgi:methylglutaconyl-CoA hydratase
LVALDETVDQFARTLAASNPDAVARIKRITWPDAEEFPRLLEERATLSGTLVLSDYTRRAIAAFSSRS